MKHDSTDQSPCSLCGGRLTTGISGTLGGSYQRCIGCWSEMQEVNPGQDSSQQFRENQEVYYGHDTIYHGHQVVDHVGERLARRRARALQKDVPPGTLLEIGPGAGHFIVAASARGYSVSALEQSPQLAALLAQNVRSPIYCGTLESHTIPDPRFDAIASFHVLEHVPDPVSQLKLAAQLVGPKGTLVIATPNARGIQHRLLRSASPSYSSAHLTLFSATGIRRAFERAGWQILSIRTTEEPENLMRAATALVRRRTGSAPGSVAAHTSPRLARWAIRIFAGLSWPLRKVLVLFGLGNELVAIARKPASTF